MLQQYQPSFSVPPLLALGIIILMVLMPVKHASAFTAITFDTGAGFNHTTLLRVNLSTGDQWRYPLGNGWSWSRSWEVNISSWHLYKKNDDNDRLMEMGLTPNFRLENNSISHWGNPYLEAGVGIHLLSESKIGTRDLGSTYHFGTHGGIGVVFGDNQQYEVAWRFEHLSNAGLQKPNPGINFTMIRFGYRW